MAYNNGYPMNYPYYQPMQNQAFQQNYQQNQAFQQQPQNYQQQNMAQNQPQIQNGGFMQIPTEEMARSYPVAPGNCVTFKIEGKPIVMEKSMGFSQLEAPKIERYRLVHEEDTQNEQISAQNEPKDNKPYNESISELKKQIEALNEEIESIKTRLGEVEEYGA